MSYVFISYSHSDKSYARLFKERLIGEGYQVWMDEDRLRIGDDWRTEIDNGLKSAFAIIILLSAKSTESQYVTYEWAYGMGLQCNVFPIRLPTSDKSKIHPKIESLQDLEFSDDEIWTKLFKELRVLRQKAYPLPSEAPESLNHIVSTLIDDKNETKYKALALNFLGIFVEESKDWNWNEQTYSELIRVLRELALGQQGNNEFHRLEAINLLVRLKVTNYPEIATQILNDKSNEIKKRSLDKLNDWSRGNAGKERLIAELLLDFLDKNRKDPFLARELIRSIASNPTDEQKLVYEKHEVQDFLTKFLEHPNGEVRSQTIGTLERIYGYAVVSKIIKVINDDEVIVCLEAIAALQNIAVDIPKNIARADERIKNIAKKMATDSSITYQDELIHVNKEKEVFIQIREQILNILRNVRKAKKGKVKEKSEEAIDAILNIELSDDELLGT